VASNWFPSLHTRGGCRAVAEKVEDGGAGRRAARQFQMVVVTALLDVERQVACTRQGRTVLQRLGEQHVGPAAAVVEHQRLDAADDATGSVELGQPGAVGGEFQAHHAVLPAAVHGRGPDAGVGAGYADEAPNTMMLVGLQHPLPHQGDAEGVGDDVDLRHGAPAAALEIGGDGLDDAVEAGHREVVAVEVADIVPAVAQRPEFVGRVAGLEKVLARGQPEARAHGIAVDENHRRALQSAAATAKAGHGLPGAVRARRLEIGRKILQPRRFHAEPGQQDLARGAGAQRAQQRGQQHGPQRAHQGAQNR
jgi:hypothetical protein